MGVVKKKLTIVGLVAGLLAPSAVLRAQEDTTSSGETSAGDESQETTEARIDELERQISLLTEELEKIKLGDVAEEAPPTGQHGLAPSASKVYRIDRGVSFGGYGEAIFQDFASQRDDGSASGKRDQFDFLRAILYFGYKWNERILFNSEIEFEHASTGDGGEVSVEFAYLDFFFRPEINLRGGMVLIPVGFINELHEPPVFHGATRPQVERFIIPATWRENGAGAFGDIGPLTYRSYVVAGLRSSGFSSSSGLRGGRQKGARSIAEDFAWTGRVDLADVPGLLAGVSFFIGNSGQGDKTDEGEAIGAKVGLFDVHVQYNTRGLQLRGLYAHGSVEDTDAINANNGLTGDESVGSRFRGGYVEAAFDLLSLRKGGASWSLYPFARYESYDTQSEVPDGYWRDPANDRAVWTFGFDVRPIPSVVVKLEYQDFADQASTGVDRWNVALGYMF